MKTIIFAVLLLAVAVSAETKSAKILIITGGHDFEQEEFYAMFTGMAGVQWDSVSHPNANSLYDSSKMSEYDVLVFYDMNQIISDDEKEALLQLAKSGKGLLFLHHSLASYQSWDEFLQLLGGRYFLKPADSSRASTYKHGLDVSVKIADPEHPVVNGLNDFVIHDEVYGNFEVLPSVHVLLQTDHPESGRIIGWANRWQKSRVVYLQPGHDHVAYENENYQRLLKNAILWLAGRETPK